MLFMAQNDFVLTKCQIGSNTSGSRPRLEQSVFFDLLNFLVKIGFSHFMENVSPSLKNDSSS